MDRRSFLKIAGAAGITALMPKEAKAMLSGLDLSTCDLSNRKLVLIELNGGNDGLNTVVPLNQYDLYSNLRPVIRVPESGNHQYIHLDSSLADDQQVGLHPALTEFKDLYDSGNLRIVQSVGYPKQNKSHFASRDLYNTGNDGNGYENGRSSGWIGRFMENRYSEEISLGYPFAIQLGSVKNSLGFHGEDTHGMSLNITKQDTAGFYSIIDGLAGDHPTATPQGTDYGTEMDYILKMDSLSNVFAESVSSAFTAGSNSVSYPSHDLANQLKTVAKLIKGGLQSMIYMVRIDGFDTHARQVDTGNGDMSGKHYSLLRQLSQSVKAFMDDMEDMNGAEDIVAVTYSEFGRKAAENGSRGTDHGEVAPMFVIGKSINGGVSGTNPDLNEPVKANNWQIQTVQYDYRSVFGSILKDYLGGDQSVLDAAFFNHTQDQSFAKTVISDLVKSKYRAYNLCDEKVGFEQIEIENERAGWFATPNPFVDYVDLRSDHRKEVIGVKVYSLRGGLVKTFHQPSNNGYIRLQLNHIKAGAYYAVVYIKNSQPERVTIIKG